MIAALRDAFARAAFADLTALIPTHLRARIEAEVTAVLDTAGVRRDIHVAATGASPRRYRVAARDVLAATAPATVACYRSAELQSLVAAIANEPVVPVPYEPEELIATRLEFAGDTHGWHWDDYAYALVWVLRAPAPEDGGSLELIRDVPWCKSEPRVDAIVAQRMAERRHVAGGTVYLLRTDTTLHRVTPLVRAGRRDAVCFSFAAQRELGRPISHETLDAILGLQPA